MPVTSDAVQPARWLDLRSPDPDHTGYAGHRAWATQLAAGCTAALAAYTAAIAEEPLQPQVAQPLRAGTVVVPAGQLSEWVLDDLQEKTMGVRG